jgi:hypothetical protein
VEAGKEIQTRKLLLLKQSRRVTTCRDLFGTNDEPHHPVRVLHSDSLCPFLFEDGHDKS